MFKQLLIFIAAVLSTSVSLAAAPKYDAEVPTFQIRDQGRTGMCSLFLMNASLENVLFSKLGKPVALSQDFLLARFLINDLIGTTAHSALEGGEAPLAKIRDRLQEMDVTGGDTSEGLYRIQEIGHVPETSWQPRQSIPWLSHTRQLVKDFDSQRVQFLLAYDGFRKNVAEFMSIMAQQPGVKNVPYPEGAMTILKSRIRHEIDLLDRWLPEYLYRVSIEDYQRILNAAESVKRGHALVARLLSKLVEKRVSKLPVSFDFDGKSYSPKQFGDEVLALNGLRLTELLLVTEKSQAHASDPNAKPGDFETLVDGELFKREDVERLVREKIDQKKNVLLGISWFKEFEQPGGYLVLPKDYQHQEYDKLLGRDDSHAISIVGYKVENGRVAWWKLQNSWGPKSGDNGFYHVSADYFWQMSHKVSYFEKAKSAGW